jgi:hypothetical protein
MMTLIERQIVGTQVLNGLAKASDPFDYIYECISATHGWVIHDYVSALYNEAAHDHGLHPDDDFEGIINYVLDDLEA